MDGPRTAASSTGRSSTLDPERADAALAALDRYEGDEYERITVRTEAGVEVAAYAWIAPLTGCRARRRRALGRPDRSPKLAAPDGR